MSLSQGIDREYGSGSVRNVKWSILEWAIFTLRFYFSLRDIKITYNHIKNIQSRAEIILKDLAKKNVLTTDICQEIVAAKSLDELDHLVRTISECAKED